MSGLVNTFVVLFIVVDPIGVAAMFAAFTHGATLHEQRRMALRGTALAAAMLLLFYLIGDTLLQTLGITLPAFRIAGGLLLLLLAIDMVFARQSGLRSATVREQEEAEQKQDITVFPLAFPLMAGPGALTTVLLMSASWEEPLRFVGNIVVLAIVLLCALTTLLMAARIVRLLGETGVNVISRILGLILAALAVQFVLDGVRASGVFGG
jgi:multiple antibiotic resistance protein